MVYGDQPGQRDFDTEPRIVRILRGSRAKQQNAEDHRKYEPKTREIAKPGHQFRYRITPHPETEQTPIGQDDQAGIQERSLCPAAT